MKRSIIAIGIGMLLTTCAGLCAAPDVSAQVPGGTFDQMSPGNQKVARALFEAQKSGPGTHPLTLDEIAARKKSGQGWGKVFDGMKSQGLVTTRNLGQAVSNSNHRHHSASTGTVTTAANRSVRTTHAAGSGRQHGMAASTSNPGRATVSASGPPAHGNGTGGMSAGHGAGRGK